MRLQRRFEVAAATTTSSVTRKRTDDAWAEIDAGDGRRFLYGPRLGRLYLLHPAQASDLRLLSIIGLPAARRQREVPDPVERVAHDRSSLAHEPPDGRPTFWLRLAYRSFQITRGAIPFHAMALLAHALAPLLRGRAIETGADASAIGRLVHAAEARVSDPNCYPRALLTALLAAVARRRCTLLIGLLAPTHKMHAWCSVESELPYEPSPEHYLYQPLWALTLHP